MVKRNQVFSILLVIINAIPSISISGDYYNQYNQNNHQITVVTRQESLTVLPTPEPDHTQPILDAQWRLVTDAIPIPEPIKQKDLFKRFSFRQNIGDQNPQPVQTQRLQQTRTVTKTYTGYIKQSVRVESNGSITISR